MWLWVDCHMTERPVYTCDSHVTNKHCFWSVYVHTCLTPLGTVVTLDPINTVVNEGEGPVTFNISATREVSITIQTISGSAGTTAVTSIIVGVSLLWCHGLYHSPAELRIVYDIIVYDIIVYDIIVYDIIVHDIITSLPGFKLHFSLSLLQMLVTSLLCQRWSTCHLTHHKPPLPSTSLMTVLLNQNRSFTSVWVPLWAWSSPVTEQPSPFRMTTVCWPSHVTYLVHVYLPAGERGLAILMSTVDSKYREPF